MIKNNWEFIFQGEKSIGLMWWMLAREILLLRGKISRTTGFVIDGKEIMPDLYFYRYKNHRNDLGK